MKKIAILINHIYIGGAENYSRDLAKILEEDGFQVDIFCFSASIPLGNNEFVINAIKLSRILWQYDFVISNMFRMNMWVRLLSFIKGYRKTKVINVLHGYYEIKKFRLFFYKHTSYLCDAMICVSKPFFDESKVVLGVAKLHLIDNFINTNKFTPDSNKNEKILTLVTAARLESVKRIDLSIKVVSILKGNGIDCKLNILGNGSLINDLKSLAVSLGVQESVIFHGAVADILPVLRCSDIYICTSLSETFCLSVAEAMSCGLSVITTPCGGPEYLLNHDPAFIAREHSAEAIAERIAAIYQLTNEQKVYFSANNRARVVDNFGNEAFSRKWRNILSSLQ